MMVINSIALYIIQEALIMIYHKGGRAMSQVTCVKLCFLGGMCQFVQDRDRNCKSTLPVGFEESMRQKLDQY